MNEPTWNERYSLTVLRTTTVSSPTYSLDETARLAGLHPEMVRHYCHLGLLGAARTGAGADLWFDDDAVYELRQFERYRKHHRVDRETVRLIFELKREVERLQAEVRFLRGP
ncbi:MAG: MerR family transcriptional regulator [Verrucomicrobia bacterium]|nr:MerR family transcriptional regulator [Verrucomicrobiota bacterium]